MLEKKGLGRGLSALFGDTAPKDNKQEMNSVNMSSDCRFIQKSLSTKTKF